MAFYFDFLLQMNIHMYANLMFFSLKRAPKTCIRFWLTGERALLPLQEEEDTARRGHVDRPGNTCLRDVNPMFIHSNGWTEGHSPTFSLPAPQGLEHSETDKQQLQER